MRNTLSVLFFIVSISLFSQELNCIISIDNSLVQTQETQVFTEMKANMFDFMNNRTWTEDEFEPEERIKCYITIQLMQGSDVANGVYRATARINSVRPVYGSDYETSVLDYVDQDFNFSYNQDANLNYSENTYSSSLSSLLSFYAYVFLAYDYDTFSELGGSLYFEKARDIINQTQAAIPNDKSWNSIGERTNRFYLIDDALSNQIEPLRKFYYSYHLKALDQLSSKSVQGQKIIHDGLKEIEKVRDVVPISPFIQTFFNAKKKELIDIYKPAIPAMKENVYELLRRIDPTNTKDYNSLKE